MAYLTVGAPKTYVTSEIPDIDRPTNVFNKLDAFVGEPDTPETRAAITNTVAQYNYQTYAYDRNTWDSVQEPYIYPQATEVPLETASSVFNFDVPTVNSGNYIQVTGTSANSGTAEMTWDTATGGMESLVNQPGTLKVNAGNGNIYYINGQHQVDRVRYQDNGTVEVSFNVPNDAVFYDKDFRENYIKDTVRQHMKSNLLIKTSIRQKILGVQATPQELKARETLRDIITEKEWRRYVTNGFLMVKGTSGKWYQVFNNQSHLRVYDKGKFIKEICIHTDNSCPPTDHVLNIKMLVEFDENQIWTGGNIYDAKNYRPAPTQESENVISLFKTLKKEPSIPTWQNVAVG